MTAIAQTVLRILAIVGKELVEVVRRPGAMLSLVLGPFLIMAIFGLGYNGVRRPLDTIVVIPPASELPADAARYQELAGGGLRIVDVVPDREAAVDRLRSGEVDVVVVAPEDPSASFEAGEQSTIEVIIDATEDGCVVRFGDYREVDGRRFPHRIEVRHGDDLYGQIQWKQIELASGVEVKP